MGDYERLWYLWEIMGDYGIIWDRQDEYGMNIGQDVRLWEIMGDYGINMGRDRMNMG